jgi:hypothetical protein
VKTMSEEKDWGDKIIGIRQTLKGLLVTVIMISMVVLFSWYMGWLV